MRITIGITTFNRLSYLEKMSRSLRACKGLEMCNVRVYDDCSTELNRESLTTLFPDAQEIKFRPVTLGPCRNMWQMYCDFLETGDDLLLAADADLLFHPECLNFIAKSFLYSDGILSLYNSALHKPKRNIKIGELELVEKKHIGSAGTIMNRETVEEIINNVPFRQGYDWAWSEFLRSSKKRLLVSKISYVQHIGLFGVNCDGFRTIDFGLNFIPGNVLNEQYLINFVHETLTEIQKHSKNEIKRKPQANKTLKLVKKMLENSTISLG